MSRFIMVIICNLIRINCKTSFAVRLMIFCFINSVMVFHVEPDVELGFKVECFGVVQLVLGTCTVQHVFDKLILFTHRWL